MSSPCPIGFGNNKKKNRSDPTPIKFPPANEDKMTLLRTHMNNCINVYFQDINLGSTSEAHMLLCEFVLFIVYKITVVADHNAERHSRNEITVADVKAGVRHVLQARSFMPKMTDYANSCSIINKKQLPKPRQVLHTMPNDVVAKNKEILANAAKKEKYKKMVEEQKRLMNCQAGTSVECTVAPISSTETAVLLDEKKDD